jgi:uncharacterized protein YjbJ (UPF0337 family)
MSSETVTGKFDQVKGQIKQSIGEATGNESLANSGAADQVKGHVKEAWGNTKDAANAVANDAKREAAVDHAEAKIHGEETAHNVREHVVNAAASVKDAVVRHTDHVKADH